MSDSQRQAGRVDDDEREGFESTAKSTREGQYQTPPPSPTDSGDATGSRVFDVNVDADRNIDFVPNGRENGNKQGCVIIGPSGAGKTTLLAAMHRACQMSENDGLDLDFAAKPKEAVTSITARDDENIEAGETAELIKEGIANILGLKKGYDATPDVKLYPFHIGVTEKRQNFWSMPSFTDLDVEMTDGGGGFIFAPTNVNSRFRNATIRRIQRANALVFCVDVNAPNLDVIYQEIEKMLANTRMEIEDRVKNPLLARLFQRFVHRRHIPEYAVRRKMLLNVDRFLILLTQVDRLTKDFANPLRTARQAEPVALARETLHPELLRSILKSLKSDAQLAVGLCSGYGFIPKSGVPFADAVGKPDIYSNETGEIRLRFWTPFGVRDAIYFLATGKARGTVKRITETDLLDDRRIIGLKATLF